MVSLCVKVFVIPNLQPLDIELVSLWRLFKRLVLREKKPSERRSGLRFLYHFAETLLSIAISQFTIVI